MRNAWRLGLVLLLCAPAFAPDEGPPPEGNPYQSPGTEIQDGIVLENEFDLDSFLGQMHADPGRIEAELKSWRRREQVATALIANPTFLQRQDRRVALAFLRPLSVEQHRRLKEMLERLPSAKWFGFL